MSSVSVLAGLVTRTWVFTHPTSGKTHTIALQHHTMAGSRQLSIDGVDVPGTLGANTIVGGASILSFDVGGLRGQVSITKSGTKFTYGCEVGGEMLTEENQAASMGHAGPKLNIRVEDGDIALDADRKPVVWYRIRTTPSDGRADVVVHRRFREFHGIDEPLKSSYKGSPLLSSFPSLPSRGFKLFTDHLSSPFIESRRQGLEAYVNALARIPRMTANNDFTLFLGLADSVRETSIMFDDGPLGLTLKGSRSGAHHYVEVTGLKTKPDGSPAQAAASGRVVIGDKVSKVNGETVLDQPYDVVVAKIRSAPRPLVIHFLGYHDTTGIPTDASSAPAAAAGAGAGAAASAAPAPAPAPTLAPAPVPAPAPAPAPAFGEAGYVPPSSSSFAASAPSSDDLDLL